MSADAEQVEQAIRSYLVRVHKGDVAFTRDTDLYEDGLGLDSLATAELSATLEDELGSDPFSEGDLPQTVGDIIDFYVRVA
jgi:acyl carrier protein